MKNIKQKFYSKLLKNSITGCWNWQGNLNGSGYGRITVDGKRHAAHRFSWILNIGNIPEELCVLHKCDNRLCVNPDHLFLGTKKDNSIDCYNKGRSKCNSNLKKIIGIQNGSARITENDVSRIRHLYSEGVSQTEIAKQFSVARATIWRIINRHIWKHV